MKMKTLLRAVCGAVIGCVIGCGSAVAQYQPIPNYTGIGAGQKFRNDINNHLSGVTPIAPRIVSLPFAQLPSEQDSQEYWCLDCMRSNPCAGGGSGALAIGTRGAWSCTASGSVNGIYNVVEYGADPTGAADSAPAIQSAINAACAVNASQLPQVYFPTSASAYKTLRPIVDECNLAPNSAVPQQVRLFGDGQQVSRIKAAFYGPAVVAYPSAANGASASHGMSIITGPVGTGTKALQLTGIGEFDVDDLLAPTANGNIGPLGGLAQFDFRAVDIVDTDTTVNRCLWSSEGAWNTIKDYRGGGTTVLGTPTGFGGVCVQGGTGKVMFELKVNGVVYGITTTTVATQGTHYEVELSYDGSNIRGYFGPQGGTISAIWTQAATGTTTQRGDENDRLFGLNFSGWPADVNVGGGGWNPWKGTVQSVQFSNLARHTTASYTADSNNFASDANTSLLLNFGLVAFPSAVGNGTLPILQADTVNYQTTIPGWLVARPQGIGCCGGTVEISNLGMVPGNNTVGFLMERVAHDIHDVIPAGSYMGIESIDLDNFDSQVHDLMVSINANTNAYAGVVETSGLESIRNLVSNNVEGFELIANGLVDNIFFQNNATTICPALLFGSFTARELNDDSENGGNFPALCLRGPIEASVALSAFGPQGGSPIIQLVGNVNNLKFDQDQFVFAGTATTVADSTFALSGLGTDLSGARLQNGVPIIFQDPYFPFGTPTTDLPSGKVWTGLPYKVVHNTNLPEVVAQPQIVTAPVFNNTSAASPFSQSQPAGLQTGMLEITQVVTNANIAVTPPTGWTLIRADTSADNNVSSKLYSHPYVVSDPTTFSWTYGALGSANIQFWTWAVSGVDLFNPVQVSGANVANSGSTSITAPAQTSTYGDEPVLSIVGASTSNPTSTSGNPAIAEPLTHFQVGFYFPQVNSTAVPAITYSGYNNGPALAAQTVVFNPISSDQYPQAIARNQIDQLLRGYFDGTETTAPVGVTAFDLLWADSVAHRWKMINNNGTAAQVVASGVDINTSDQVTATHLAAPLPGAQGGLGANLSTAASGTYPKANGSGVYAASTLAASGTGTCPAGSGPVGTLNGDAAPTCRVLTSTDIDSTVARVIASGTSALGTAAIAAAPTGNCATTITTAASGVLTTDAIIWSHNAAVTAGTNGSLIIHAFPTANNVNFQECNPTAASITPPADTLNWRVVR